jgi:hypothetical protein
VVTVVAGLGLVVLVTVDAVLTVLHPARRGPRTLVTGAGLTRRPTGERADSEPEQGRTRNDPRRVMTAAVTRLSLSSSPVTDHPNDADVDPVLAE